MGRRTNKQRANAANGAKTWATIGKNPSILDAKFESSVCELVYNESVYLKSTRHTHIRGGAEQGGAYSVEICVCSSSDLNGLPFKLAYYAS